ncbi:unnamed protein product [Gordionus sp. m RMFG-2023]|uniref:uncharacterized protein LOC135929328 n=1 Tax=Gordionus sp. m RMFG-2023 TaxID=3053472 RepID=UPI0030E53D1B
MENIQKALILMKEDGIKLINITCQDILSPGNIDIVPDILWNLIVRYHILHSHPNYVHIPTDDQIIHNFLICINSILPDFKTKNFDSDWVDGARLNALIEWCQSKNSSWKIMKKLKGNDDLTLLNQSAKKAETLFNIPNIIGDVKMSSTEGMDYRAMITYLAYFTKSLHPDNTENGRNGANQIRYQSGPAYSNLLKWVNEKLDPDKPITNFASDWSDGILLEELINSFSNHYLLDINKDIDKTFAENNRLFKNQVFSKLDECIIKAKEIGIKPIINGRELKMGKLNSFYMMMYVSQFLKLDSNILKKRFLNDELMQRFKIIKKDLKKIPPSQPFVSQPCPLKAQILAKPKLKPVPKCLKFFQNDQEMMVINRDIDKNIFSMNKENDLKEKEWSIDFQGLKNNFVTSPILANLPTKNALKADNNMEKIKKLDTSKIMDKISEPTNENKRHHHNPIEDTTMIGYDMNGNLVEEKHMNNGFDAIKSVHALENEKNYKTKYATNRNEEVLFCVLDQVPHLIPVNKTVKYKFALISYHEPLDDKLLQISIETPTLSKGYSIPCDVNKIETNSINMHDFRNKYTYPRDIDKNLNFCVYSQEYTITFKTLEIGEHLIHMRYTGKDICFKDSNNNGLLPNENDMLSKACLPFKTYDASKVIYQPSRFCVLGKLTTFKIIAQDSGPGKLEVLINKGTTKSTIRSIGNKTFMVDFVPSQINRINPYMPTKDLNSENDSEVKYQSIDIKFNGDVIAGNPFKCPVVNVNRIKYEGKGLKNMIRIQTPVSFTIKTFVPSLESKDFKIDILPILPLNTLNSHDKLDQETEYNLKGPMITKPIITRLSPLEMGIFSIHYTLSSVGNHSLSLELRLDNDFNSERDLSEQAKEKIIQPNYLPLPFNECMKENGNAPNKDRVNKLFLKAFDPTAICLGNNDYNYPIDDKILISKNGDSFNVPISIDPKAGEGQLELSIDGGSIPNTVKLLSNKCNRENPENSLKKVCLLTFVPIKDFHTLEVKFNGCAISNSPFKLQFIYLNFDEENINGEICHSNLNDCHAIDEETCKDKQPSMELGKDDGIKDNMCDFETDINIRSINEYSRKHDAYENKIDGIDQTMRHKSPHKKVDVEKILKEVKIAKSSSNDPAKNILVNKERTPHNDKKKSLDNNNVVDQTILVKDDLDFTLAQNLGSKFLDKDDLSTNQNGKIDNIKFDKLHNSTFEAAKGTPKINETVAIKRENPFILKLYRYQDTAADYEVTAFNSNDIVNRKRLIASLIMPSSNRSTRQDNVVLIHKETLPISTLCTFEIVSSASIPSDLQISLKSLNNLGNGESKKTPIQLFPKFDGPCLATNNHLNKFFLTFTLPDTGNYELACGSASYDSPETMIKTDIVAYSSCHSEMLIFENINLSENGVAAPYQKFGFVGKDYTFNARFKRGDDLRELDINSMEFIINYSDAFNHILKKEVKVIKILTDYSHLYQFKFLPLGEGFYDLKFLVKGKAVKANFWQKIYIFPFRQLEFNHLPHFCATNNNEKQILNLIDPSTIFTNQSLSQYSCPNIDNNLKNNLIPPYLLFIKLDQSCHLDTVKMPYLNFFGITFELQPLPEIPSNDNNINNICRKESDLKDLCIKDGLKTKFLAQENRIKITFKPKIASKYVLTMCIDEIPLTILLVQCVDINAMKITENQLKKVLISDLREYHLSIDSSECGGLGPIFLHLEDDNLQGSNVQYLSNLNTEEKLYITDLKDFYISTCVTYQPPIIESFFGRKQSSIITISLKTFYKPDNFDQKPKTQNSNNPTPGKTLTLFLSFLYWGLETSHLTQTFFLDLESISSKIAKLRELNREPFIDSLQLYPGGDLSTKIFWVQAFRPTNFKILAHYDKFFKNGDALTKNIDMITGEHYDTSWKPFKCSIDSKFKRVPVIYKITAKGMIRDLSLSALLMKKDSLGNNGEIWNHQDTKLGCDSVITNDPNELNAVIYSVDFVPCELGAHTVTVEARNYDAGPNYEDKPIGESSQESNSLCVLDFTFNVFDVQKVKFKPILGDFLNNNNPDSLFMTLNQPCTFEVDCFKAGGCKSIDINIINPHINDEAPISHEIDYSESAIHKFKVTFVPETEAPNYLVHVSVNNEAICGSPFIAKFLNPANDSGLYLNPLESIKNSFEALNNTDSISIIDHIKPTKELPKLDGAEPIYIDDTPIQELIDRKSIEEELFKTKTTHCDNIKGTINSNLKFLMEAPNIDSKTTNIKDLLEIEVDKNVKNLTISHPEVFENTDGKKNVLVTCVPLYPGPHIFSLKTKINGRTLNRTCHIFVTENLNQYQALSADDMMIFPGIIKDIIKQGQAFKFQIYGPVKLEAKDVDVYDEHGSKFQISPNSNFGLDIEYVPQLIGETLIHVKRNNTDINGSPLSLRVFDSNKILVRDLKRAAVMKYEDGKEEANEISFLIDAKKAGIGNLEILISCGEHHIPNRVEMYRNSDNNISASENNNTNYHRNGNSKKIFKVYFRPSAPKLHHIDIKFNGQQIPGSPFECMILDPKAFVFSGPNLKYLHVGRKNRMHLYIPRDYLSYLNVEHDLRCYLTPLPYTNDRKSHNSIINYITANLSPLKNIEADKHNHANINNHKDDCISYIIEFDLNNNIVITSYEIVIQYQGVKLFGSQNYPPYICKSYDALAVRIHKFKDRIKINKLNRFYVDVSKSGDGVLETCIKTQQLTQTNFDSNPKNNINSNSIPALNYCKVTEKECTNLMVPLTVTPKYKEGSENLDQSFNLKSPSELIVIGYEINYVTQCLGLHQVDLLYNGIVVPTSPLSVHSERGKQNVWGPGISAFPIEKCPAYFYLDAKSLNLDTCRLFSSSSLSNSRSSIAINRVNVDSFNTSYDNGKIAINGTLTNGIENEGLFNDKHEDEINEHPHPSYSLKFFNSKRQRDKRFEVVIKDITGQLVPWKIKPVKVETGKSNSSILTVEYYPRIVGDHFVILRQSPYVNKSETHSSESTYLQEHIDGSSYNVIIYHESYFTSSNHSFSKRILNLEACQNPLITQPRNLGEPGLIQDFNNEPKLFDQIEKNNTSGAMHDFVDSLEVASVIDTVNDSKMAARIGYLGEIYSFFVDVPPSYPHSQHPEISIITKDNQFSKPSNKSQSTDGNHTYHLSDSMDFKCDNIFFTLGRTNVKGMYQISFTPNSFKLHQVNAKINGKFLPGFPHLINILPSHSAHYNLDSPNRLTLSPCNKNAVSPISNTKSSKKSITSSKASPKIIAPIKACISDIVKMDKNDKSHNRKSNVFNFYGKYNPYASGKGLSSCATIKDASFTLHQIGEGQDIDVIITGPKNSLIPCRCYYIQKDIYNVEYRPEQIGENKIDILVDHCKIDGSPFISYAYDPQKVKILSKDNSNSSFSVTLGEDLDIYVDCTEAGPAELKAKIKRRCKDNILIKCKDEYSLKILPVSSKTISISNEISLEGNQKAVKFRPQVKGNFLLSLIYGEHLITDPPIKIIVKTDPDFKCIFEGEGLSRGRVGETCNFKIFIKEILKNDRERTLSYTGISSVFTMKPQIMIEGPNSLPPFELVCQGENAYSVSYTPSEIGSFKINVYLNDVLEGPFNALICDLEKVKITIPPNASHNATSFETQNDNNNCLIFTPDEYTKILVDANLAGPGSLSANAQFLPTIKRKMVEIPLEIERISHDSDYCVLFMPKLPGDYFIHLKWNGYSLPKSPFIGKYLETLPDKVDKMTKSIEYSNATSIDETKNYSVNCDDKTIYNALKKILSKNYNSSPLIKIDGTVETFIMAGQKYEFTLDITLLLQKIKKEIDISDKLSPGDPNLAFQPVFKFLPQNMSIDKSEDIKYFDISVKQISPCLFTYTFIIDTIGEYQIYLGYQSLESIVGNDLSKFLHILASPYNLSCHFYERPTSTLPSNGSASLNLKQDNIYDNYTITKNDFKRNNDHKYKRETVNLGADLNEDRPIQEYQEIKSSTKISPKPKNTCDILNTSNASRVKLYGPGIKSGVLANFQSHFSIDTKGACAGQLTVKIRGPKSAFHVHMKRDAVRDRLIHCNYDPTEVGDYNIHVTWSGNHVLGSPFNVVIYDTLQELKENSETKFELSGNDHDSIRATEDSITHGDCLVDCHNLEHYIYETFRDNKGYTDIGKSKGLANGRKEITNSLRSYDEKKDISAASSLTASDKLSLDGSYHNDNTIGGFHKLSYEEWRKMH